MTWADRLMTPFDTEATGVDVETDRIVTATVLLVRGGDVAGQQWMTDPGVDIPAEATEIHGITTEQARTHGRPPAEVIAAVGDAIRAAWDDGGIVVGHNLAYDFTLLDRETRRHLGRPFTVRGPVADTFVLDKHFDRYRKGKRNLTATAAHYAVALNGAHDAFEDALGSARILWRMCRLYPELADMTWRDLYRLQVRARAEQAEGLQDYLRAKARDDGRTAEEIEAIVVDPHWPIKPYTAATTEPAGATS